MNLAATKRNTEVGMLVVLIIAIIMHIKLMSTENQLNLPLDYKLAVCTELKVHVTSS